MRNTHPRSTRKTTTTAAVVLGAALALAFPAAANAHVSVEPSTTAAGEYATLTFAIGHGCEGSPTESVRIDFPEAIGSVKPTAKAGWAVETAESGGVRSVTYTTEEPLPDELRDTVTVAALLPLDGQAGDVLSFPVTQTCTDGQNVWDQAPQDGAEPEYPMPQLTLTAATGGGEHAGHTGAGASDEDAEHADGAGKVGALEHRDDQARLLGTGGLIVGVLGVALAALSLRRRS
ncbi:YcnI family protein [Zhihengliuella sp.]|uniref:YcnI family copper-binding membrane protein n=1 Tax=Zhihengliuella sp. TaxID=1954483 RepID=UPI0028126A2D|nr:YcnI family protein [Zhihengliuella sp.]